MFEARLTESERAGLESGWLAGQPDAFRKAVRRIWKIHRCPAGTPIDEGAGRHSAFVGLAAGFLSQSIPLISAEEVAVHIASPGMWFGSALLDGTVKVRPVSLRARTDVTVVTVPVQALRSLLHERPEWWSSIHHYMMLEWELAVCVATDLLLPDHRSRLGAVLLRLSGLRPTLGSPSPDLRIPVTQRELAGMCNCSHNAVNAELGRMSQRGWVELAYGQIRILDPESIRASLLTAL